MAELVAAFNRVVTKVRFHPLPELDDQLGPPMITGDKGKIHRCTQTRGRILRIDERGEIYCERCPARWRNEGY